MNLNTGLSPSLLQVVFIDILDSLQLHHQWF